MPSNNALPHLYRLQAHAAPHAAPTPTALTKPPATHSNVFLCAFSFLNASAYETSGRKVTIEYSDDQPETCDVGKAAVGSKLCMGVGRKSVDRTASRPRRRWCIGVMTLDRISSLETTSAFTEPSRSNGLTNSPLPVRKWPRDPCHVFSNTLATLSSTLRDFPTLP